MGGWMGEIDIKDQLSPTEVEIRTEFGKKILTSLEYNFVNFMLKTPNMMTLSLQKSLKPL